MILVAVDDQERRRAGRHPGQQAQLSRPAGRVRDVRDTQEVSLEGERQQTGVDFGVLSGNNQAIIANWVRGEGIWHVDTARRASVLSDFREASGYVGAHSVIDAPTPIARLQVLAHYLDLNWPWLQARCRQLAQAGTAGLLHPRSPHISAAGVDVACAFVGQMAVDQT